jgi:hypothetical protein
MEVQHMKGLVSVGQREAHRAHVLEQVDMQALSLREAAEKSSLEGVWLDIHE